MNTQSRRRFMTNTTLASVGVVLNPGIPFRTEKTIPKSNNSIMDEVRKFRKMDAYCTANPKMSDVEKFNIERMFVGKPMSWTKWTPDEFIKANNEMMDLMVKHPGQVIGQISVNPQFLNESLEEIDRCSDKGMVGSRLYYQVKINDPLYFPIIEKLIDLNMIIFIHGEAQLGVGGYQMKYDAGRPHTISTPQDFVETAKRYPEGMFQFAHIGGGGDWEYMCKAFSESPNIYVDAGGSNNSEGMIDFAVKCLGEDRVFFGTDNSYYQSMGRILSTDLNDRQKQKIFFDNYNNVLKKGGYQFD